MDEPLEVAAMRERIQDELGRTARLLTKDGQIPGIAVAMGMLFEGLTGAKMHDLADDEILQAVRRRLVVCATHPEVQASAAAYRKMREAIMAGSPAENQDGP